MSLHELDAEIREIEARIAAERLALDDAINGCTNSLRDTVASPKTLLALTGVGFAVGKVMFGRGGKAQPEPAPAKKAGVLGLLTGVAGTAFGLMQPKFGVGSIATWAAKRYFASRNKKAAAGAPARPVASRTAPVSPAAPLRTRP
jgi:hypothetical protein